MHNGYCLPIDPELQRRIEELAQAVGLRPVDLVRAACEEYAAARGGRTWGERAQRLGLVGCVEDAAPDLSTDPAYFEGFGRE